MTDEERQVTISDLRRRLSETTARKAAVEAELKELASRVPEIRETLGNPFFYSGKEHGRPENEDKSIAKYTGSKSHQPGLLLVFKYRDAERELTEILEQLRDLGVSTAHG